MQKRSRSFWIGSTIFGAVVVAAALRFYPSEEFEVASIEAIVNERKHFDAMHPLKNKIDAEEDNEKVIKEHSDRNQAFAAASRWNGKTIVVHGYWNSPFEGMSIYSKTTGKATVSISLKPSPDYLKPKSRLALLLHTYLPHSKALEQDDFVRITGVYHATNYRGSWGLMESVDWIEFHKIELWDQANQRWQ